jgi:hypothetical protein
MASQILKAKLSTLYSRMKKLGLRKKPEALRKNRRLNSTG